jgi:hypothetical protein
MILDQRKVIFTSLNWSEIVIAGHSVEHCKAMEYCKLSVEPGLRFN